MKTYTFFVQGMHCNSCVLLTEGEIGKLSHVHSVKASLHKKLIEVTGDFSDRSPQSIAEELTITLKPHGYTVSVEKIEMKKNWSEFKIAIPIALLFILLFIALQKLGIVDLVNSNNVGYGTAFVIGVVASLSTCMAVVGGLVLSMSATLAKREKSARPQLIFHVGRIVSFFVLGGLIGAIGSAFTLSAGSTFILSIVIGIVMLIMGINLLGIFHWSKRLQPSMPKFIAKRAHGISKLNHSLTPLLLGVATFFLPCGFTQSMQLYTLTTGSFWSGGLTMLAFALGTLPVLAIISFSSLSLRSGVRTGIFFKSAGLIVIAFAIFNLINGLTVVGVIPPLFNF